MEVFSNLQETISILHTLAFPKIEESTTMPQQRCESIATKDEENNTNIAKKNAAILDKNLFISSQKI